MLLQDRNGRSPRDAGVWKTGVAMLAVLTMTWSCGEPVGPPQGPSVVIVAPTSNATFAGGQEIDIVATATDAWSDELPAAQVQWWADLHHDTHKHPAQPPTQGATGTLVVPTSGHTDANVWYRIYVAATDGTGRSDTAFVDVQPQLVSVAVTTAPPGLQVTIDGQPRMTPIEFEAIVGMERQLGVIVTQSQASVEYQFDAWEHGGAALQTIVIPDSDLALSARFVDAGVANVPPVVALTAPADAATATVDAPVTVTVDATDVDGSIARVDLFVDGVRVSETTTAPFSLEWAPSTTGPHVLRVRAVDDDGAYAFSQSRSVLVLAAGGGDVTPPVATLTAPVQGSSDLTGAVTLSANATDDVGVASVEFAVDGVVIATDDAAPYEAMLPATSPYTAGVHVLRARARDAAGNWSPWSSSRVTFGGSSDLPDGFVREQWVTGFSSMLTSIAIAPDGRMFVAERGGKLRVVKNGSLAPAPFVTVQTDESGERGLLGVALHPNFAANGYVYLFYTTLTGDVARSRISRFVADGDIAVPGSENIIAELPPLSGSGKHNGGAMHFGPDGKLYVAVGDNTDPSAPQSLDSPFGKVLRFNPDGSMPADNPFVASATGLQQAIWARGLRNPFTFAFDSITGRMFINDVGAAAWEEINLGRAGANYGWPLTEGHTDDPAFDAPLVAYPHPGTGGSTQLFDGFAVVGAAFYRPATASFGTSYLGQYFFADYVNGWVNRVDPANHNAVYAFARLGGSPTDLAIGHDGALYVLIDTRIERIRR